MMIISLRRLLFFFPFLVLHLGLKSQNFSAFDIVDREEMLYDFDEKTIRFGFFLNLNYFDYRLSLDPKYGVLGEKPLVSADGLSNFGVGLIGKIRLSDHFDLRLEPNMQFIERTLLFDTQTNDQYIDPERQRELTQRDKKKKVKATHIDIPLLLEIHGNRWFNSRPYLAGGLDWILNLESNFSRTEDNLQGVFRTLPMNFAWTTEIGIQFYLRNFKMTPALRGVFVLNNELKRDNEGTPPYWSAAISSIQSRAVMFILKFE